MRTILSLLLCVLFIGCATNNPPPAVKTKPYVGMTKDEVLRNYGKPGKQSRSDEGEVWTYDNLALAAIPFNFGFRAKFHTFVFDETGRVKKFNVDDF